MDAKEIKKILDKFKSLKDKNPKEVAYIDAVETLELAFLLISKFEENPRHISISHDDWANGKINFSRIKFLLEDLKMANIIDYLIFSLGGHAQFEIVKLKEFEERVLDDVSELMEKYEEKPTTEIKESANKLAEENFEKRLGWHIKSFKGFVERDGFKTFWLKSNKSRQEPEEIGRQLLMAYLNALSYGVPMREIPAGAGRMDIIFIQDPFNKSIIEVKVNPDKTRYDEGLEQLNDYLDKHALDEGFYVIYNSGETGSEEIKFKGKKIIQIYINIKQEAPTKKFRSQKGEKNGR